MSWKAFLQKAFRDRKESAQAQHQVDRARFQAIKAEQGAAWEEGEK